MDATRVEFVENLKEVLGGSGEAVARPNMQHIEAPPPGVFQHPVECGTACLRSPDATVYIFLRDV